MAATSAPSFLSSAFERAGDVAAIIPLHLAAASVVTVSVPIWREWLRYIGDAAADVAPIVTLVALLLSVWTASRAGKPTGAGAKTASAAAKVASKFGLWSLILVVATLGVYAVVSLFMSKRADAAPAVATGQARAGRKRTADDAGEDGNAEDDGEDTSADPPWLTQALDDAETKRLREFAGKKANPLILKLFADAGHPGIKSDEVSWCAAYVCALLERAGVSSPKTLMARDFEKWGKNVDKPQRGDVVVIWRESPKSWKGHVFFYVDETKTHIIGVGGNQSDNVTIAKFPKNRVRGYFRSKSLWSSKTILSAVGSGAAGTGTAATVVGELASTPDKPSAAGHAAEAIEAIKGPAESISQVLPDESRWKLYLILGCALLGVAAAVLIAYERRKQRQTRGV